MLKVEKLLMVCVGMVLFCSLSLRASTMGNTLNITTGTTIERTWADVVADNYAYGAKQSYDSATNETHIWLPYGNTDGVYYDADHVNFRDPSGGDFGIVFTNVGSHSSYLTYKLHFDTAIGSFR